MGHRPPRRGRAPPGYFGNGWKHPTRQPASTARTLPYATNFLELPHPDITLKPNHEQIRYEDFNQIHKHKLQSTGMAFLEKREGESAGPFSAEAKREPHGAQGADGRPEGGPAHGGVEALGLERRTAPG